MPKERETRREIITNTLEEYLQLETEFVSPPQVRLELMSQAIPGEPAVNVRDAAITTSVQCYAPGVAKMKPRRDEKSIAIAESTLKAGHHTTRQHFNYTWKIIGVSRSVVHDVLHGNPFYNSEQQSQRYVEIKPGSYLRPTSLSPEQEAIFTVAGDYANNAYFELLTLLEPEINQRMKAMYPEDGWKKDTTAKRLDSKSAKLAQEVARYVLPIAQQTTFDHTLSELQLLRLFHASKLPNFSDEARLVIAKMIEEVAKVDPSIIDELDIPLETPEERISEEYLTTRQQEFDQELGAHQSVLVSIPANARELLAKVVNNQVGLGARTDQISQTLDFLLNPKQNPVLADVYEVGMMDPLTESMRAINVTFATILTHTGDSQRQRHRRTFGVTPTLEDLYNHQPDFGTPMIIRDNPELLTTYQEMMTNIYGNVERALAAGIPTEYALLLLPNAHNIRVFETGDLFDWVHRFKQRLCYLAQEEIFFISVEQVEQILKVIPEAKYLLQAPCGVRQEAGFRPRCPEGDRWCGKPVYNWSIDEYAKNRLV